MDQFKQSVKEADRLRRELPGLKQDSSKEGMIKYNKALLEATDRQHNIYTRLRLMQDKESVQVADEMIHVAETYLDKPSEVSMDAFFTDMKEEIAFQLRWLTSSDYEE